jgi:hypothetical protein
VITATPLIPNRIQRESKIRCETTLSVDGVDLADITPWFAIVTWDTRPTVWRGGQWKDSGNRIIAQTPVLGMEPFILPPGVWFPFLRLPLNLEAIVIALGRLTVV